MAQPIACIAVDWGTSNRRAWALDGSGRVVAARADDQGLLAIKDRAFGPSLQGMAGDWLASGAPIIMCGMVGSRLGWHEVPYLEAPVDLSGLGQHLFPLPDVAPARAFIVPGVARSDGEEADVMRGEECQLLGAALAGGAGDGVFLLPGTHAKWAIMIKGRLTDFRTYMTGEIFSQLRQTGSLSQLMGPDKTPFVSAAFERGLRKVITAPTGLTHDLFGVRSLSLLGKLRSDEAPSYLSGLLIGAEIGDALAWAKTKGQDGEVTAIGSARLLEAYEAAASIVGIKLARLENETILPPALFAIAKQAGLLDA